MIIPRRGRGDLNTSEPAAWDWQVAVFGLNEAWRLGDCIKSIASAARGWRVLVTVILNGTTDNSAAVALDAARSCLIPLDVYRIKYADKSNAINAFLYDLRAPSRFHCCVDAYVTIGPATLSGFAHCWATHPEARAVTGICLNGRSEALASAQILSIGGALRGQLFSLQREFIDRFTSQGLRLPVGMYRGDGLLGSMAAHDLDSLGQPWDNTRIVGVRTATYEIETLSVFRLRDWHRQFRRKIRQMRGQIENAAVKRIIYRYGYAALPHYADEMIADFLAEEGLPASSLSDFPFMRLALRQHRRALASPHSSSLRPAFIGSTRTPIEQGLDQSA